MSDAVGDFFFRYIELGTRHVIPLGIDHVLFILSLYLLNSKFKSVLLQCTVFTFAHSFSMAFVVFGNFIPSTLYVEPLITLSILYTCIENILNDDVNRFRLFIVFLFGLVHGLGFGSTLYNIGLPISKLTFALFSFNIGVEIGQVLVIFLAYILVGKWFSSKSWYKKKIVYPISSVIGCIALVMTTYRILEIF